MCRIRAKVQPLASGVHRDVEMATPVLRGDEFTREADITRGDLVERTTKCEVVGTHSSHCRVAADVSALDAGRVEIYRSTRSRRPTLVPPDEFESIRHADERGDIVGGRGLVDPFRGVVLLDPARLHDGESVAERKRLGLVMGDEYGREAQTLMKLMNLGPHLIAQSCIEIAQGFVEQHQIGLCDQSARHRHSLLLPTAELGGIPVEQGSAVHHSCCGFDLPGGDGALHSSNLQRVSDVFAHRHVGPQRVGLEDHADVALVGRNVDPGRRIEDGVVLERDRPALGCLEAGDAAERGRLPATAGAEQDEEFTVLDVEVELIDDGVGPEGLGQVGNPELRCHLGTCLVARGLSGEE